MEQSSLLSFFVKSSVIKKVNPSTPKSSPKRIATRKTAETKTKAEEAPTPSNSDESSCFRESSGFFTPLTAPVAQCEEKKNISPLKSPPESLFCETETKVSSPIKYHFEASKMDLVTPSPKSDECSVASSSDLRFEQGWVL
jgi:hypothetical protein